MTGFLKRWLLAMASVVGSVVIAILACWALLAAANSYGWERVALFAFLGGTAVVALATKESK